MKKHTKIYMDFFGYKIPEDCFCEICRAQAKDVHHIEARGMGGNPSGSKDVIENLQALCRRCHIEYGDKKQYKEKLKSIHKKFMYHNKKK